jgi:hypothetical protein
MFSNENMAPQPYNYTLPLKNSSLKKTDKPSYRFVEKNDIIFINRLRVKVLLKEQTSDSA